MTGESGSLNRFQVNVRFERKPDVPRLLGGLYAACKQLQLEQQDGTKFVPAVSAPDGEIEVGLDTATRQAVFLEYVRPSAPLTITVSSVANEHSGRMELVGLEPPEICRPYKMGLVAVRQFVDEERFENPIRDPTFGPLSEEVASLAQGLQDEMLEDHHPVITREYDMREGPYW